MLVLMMWWEGIDGFCVLVQFLIIFRDVQYLLFLINYKLDLMVVEVVGIWCWNIMKEYVCDLLIVYGYGDGGGGFMDELIWCGKVYQVFLGVFKVKFFIVC